MPSKDPLTRFGSTLLQLMISRNLTTWRGLMRLLASHGHSYSSASFSAWAYGHSSVPKTLPPALAEVLDLDAEERAKLADAFAYGQDEPITLGDH